MKLLTVDEEHEAFDPLEFMTEAEFQAQMAIDNAAVDEWIRSHGVGKKYSEDQERDSHGRWTSGGVEPAAVVETILGDNSATVSGAQLAELARSPGGGFTYDLRTGEPVTGGFAVATFGNERPVEPDESLGEAIERYVSDKADILALPGNMLGAWHDDIPDSKTFGQVVLDISHVVATHDEAVEYGRAQKQTAIFDLTTFETEDIRAARMDAGLTKWLAELEGD